MKNVLEEYKESGSLYITGLTNSATSVMALDFLLKNITPTTKLEEEIAIFSSVGIYEIMGTTLDFKDKFNLIKIRSSNQSKGAEYMVNGMYHHTNSYKQPSEQAQLISLSVKRLIETLPYLTNSPDYERWLRRQLYSMDTVIGNMFKHLNKHTDKKLLAPFLAYTAVLDFAEDTYGIMYLEDTRELIYKVAQYIYGPRADSIMNIAKNFEQQASQEFWLAAVNEEELVYSQLPTIL